MKTLIKYSTLALFILTGTMTLAQRGKIITPAQTNPISTSPVMDPNRDQYVSKTTAGFSNDGYYVDEFEIPMFGIPKLGGDVTGDNIGQACGITDLIPDRDGYSVYAVRDANNNLIFRFRVGRNNPSVEAWTILLDTDGKFGASDPNATAFNPGFEIDITLIKRNNAGIFVYNVDGIESCPTALKNYPLSTHFQIAVGDEVSCGDADFFYDFYVPFSEIAALFGINENTGLRYAAVTNVSATCAMGGKIADISGVDYTEYNDCVPCAWTDLIENQCPTPVVDLCETCAGFSASLPKKPTINEPVKAGNLTVSGTGKDGNYLKLQVFSRIGGTDASPIWSTTPREEHVKLIVGTTWSVTLNGPLQAYDRIVATAMVNSDGTGCGSFDGNAASTSVTIVNPNAAPVAQNQTVDVIEDTPKDIVLVATDPEGDPLTYVIVTPPSNGVLTGTGPNVTYTPNLNYFGPDSFTFQAKDNAPLSSNIATVTINVIPVNDAPIANDDAFSTNEDTPLNASVAGNDSDVDGPGANYTVVSGPSNGNLVLNANGTFTYTPNLNFNGTDQFVYSLCDGGSPNLCDNATVTITVNAVNDPPIANDDAFSTDEDTPLSASVTANDSDPDGPNALYSVVTGPSNGNLTLNVNGNFTYTPNLNFNGTDSFVYMRCDGGTPNLCDNATVTITVNPVNDAPVANDDSFSTNEDTPLSASVAGNDTDVDGPGATYSVFTGPSNGNLVLNTNGSFTYTPNLNFNGVDTFVYTLCDGGSPNLCDNATVTITVIAVNDAPVADDQTVDVIEDTPKAITLTGSDVEGSPLTFTIVSQPTKGVLTGSGANRTYTPNLNYFGPDSFTFQVSDGQLFSNIATVTINVIAVNDAPVANDDAFSTDEDTPLNADVSTNDSDVDGPGANYTVVSGPSNGNLVLNANGTFTYTPNLNFNGTDQFVYSLCDGGSPNLCDNATVTITVNPVNNAPVANDDAFSTNEDTPLNANVSGNDTDVDGPGAIYSVVSGPSNGSLTLNANGSFTYTPNLNYNGGDSFVYMLCDGGTPNLCNNATVTITVNPVNDPPVITGSTAQTMYVAGGVVIDNTLMVTDVDNPTIVSVIVTITNNFTVGDLLNFTNQSGITGSYNATSGVLTLTGTATLAQYSTAIASIVYENDAAFGAPKRITFVANDGTSNSLPWHSFIAFQPNANDPVLNNDTFVTDEDVPLVTCLDVTDADGDDVFIDSFSNSSGNGGYTLNGGVCFTFTPNANFFGVETVDVRICDNGIPNRCITETLTITVNPVNDAPVANNQTVNVPEDTPTAITLTGSDIENDPLTFELMTSPTKGVLTGTIPNYTYTPNLNYNGPDSFTFRVNDGSLNSNIATVSINVTPINDAPVANDDTFVTNEDTALNANVATNDSDVDGPGAIYSVFTAPANGNLVLNANGTFTYTPNLNFNGVDTFVYTRCDGGTPNLCDNALVTITVNPVNDAPVANNQNVIVIEDTPKAITLTGSDVENDALTYTIVLFPTKGTLSGTAPNLTYTPNLDYVGPDSFTFFVNDGEFDSNIATVSITVTPVNDPPVAVNDMITTPEDTPVTFNITANDTDVDGTINAATVDLDPSTPAEDKSFTVPGEGTYTVDNAGNVTFTPALNYNGTTTAITYTVKDNDGALSNEGTIVINVTPVNDPPVITPQVVNVDEDDQVTICVTVTDVENDPSKLKGAISLGGNGTIALDTVGGKLCFIYTPNPDYNGPDQVEVTVCDKNDPTVCSTQTININVLPVNDKPVIIVGGNPVDSLFVTTPEDTDLFFCFEFQDIDGDNTFVDSYTNLSGGGTFVPGVGNPNEHCFTFTPVADYFGKSIWDVRVCDDGSPSLCTKLIVVINVTPVNDAPIAFDQTVEVMEDTPKVITMVGTDVDGDALTYHIDQQPVNGTLSLNGAGPNITYTPKLNYFGPDSYTFHVNDGTINSNIATVTINVLPVNDPPVIMPFPTLFTKEDSLLRVCVGVTDVDGDIITYLPASNTKGGGTMVLDVDPFAFCYIFTPPPNYNGESIWQMSVSDGKVTVSAPVKIIVLPVNDPPVARNDFYEVRSGVDTTFNALTNDLPIVAPFKEFYDIYEADSVDLLTMTHILLGPYHGTATFEPSGVIQYKSNFGYMGPDSIRYRVCDSGKPALCDTAVVFIEVAPAPFKIYEALSPNGDGLNDYWRIDGIEAYPNNRVRVFDRYNNMVFETRGYNNDSNHWRGQFNHGLSKANLPEGTYFYSVELGNGQGSFSGYVVLKLN